MRNSIRHSKLRVAFRWSPLIFLLSVVLQLPLVQAQDGGFPTGRQAFVSYELSIENTRLDRFCLGHTAVVPVSVKENVLVEGEPNAGAVEVRNLDVAAGSSNDSIATADIGRRFVGGVLVTGVAVGTTTINISVTVYNTHRLGFANTFVLQKSFPVRVVPCAYRVDMTTFWVTTMYSADVLISTNMVNIPLKSNTGLSFSNDSRSPTESALRWAFTTNRLTGCEVGSDTFREQGVSINAQITDDTLSGTVTIPELPTSSNLYIQCHRNLPENRRIQSCDEYRDGTCHPANEGGRDSFSPEAVPFSVPIDGGSITVDHTLNHSQGSATGRTTITITPLEVQ
ncbi:MAG: hypothetical protein K8L91_05895 [Anaerolineae bacterium]|nr:hypothetical protein [Anaerolineae bacterium]